MLRTLFAGIAIAGLFALGIATPMSAQTEGQSTKQHMKKAGKAAKKAGKATGEAAKETGKATGHAAKKAGQVTEDAAKETGTGAKKAAKKVGDKVAPDTTTATCNDGTVQTGKTKTTACANHGGVKG
jgi:hypothetical protein